MDKKPLIVVSICAVVLLVLGSLSNVVGYQTVQSSNQNTINNEVNQKELLFQAIVDIMNNKEIQKIIFKSQIDRGKSFYPDSKFSVFTSQILTKSNLKYMYIVGLMLSKAISKSRMHLIIEKYQLGQGVQNEITAAIERDTKLNEEIKQLSNSNCDCENDSATLWSFPVLCMLLFPVFIVFFIIAILSSSYFYPIEILMYIGLKLNCFWYLGPLVNH